MTMMPAGSALALLLAAAGCGGGNAFRLPPAPGAPGARWAAPGRSLTLRPAVRVRGGAALRAAAQGAALEGEAGTAGSSGRAGLRNEEALSAAFPATAWPRTWVPLASTWELEPDRPSPVVCPLSGGLARTFENVCLPRDLCSAI